jgi:Ca-activated chloride channel family protein
VSFAAPAFLVALALVPLALLAQLAARRRALRYAVRVPAVASVRLAVGTTPAWRKHVPAALALAAVALLALALARPQRTIAVPIERASIMLVTDHSGSMAATDVDPNRLQAAQAAAHTFLDRVPGAIRVGVATYSTTVDAVQTPTRDHARVERIVDQQDASGATATGDALQIALDSLAPGANARARVPSAIVLLSDGATTAGRDPVIVARAAGRAHVPIYTVSLGTDAGVVQGSPFGDVIPVPPDPQTLGAIARASGGRSFTAEDASSLSSIYKALGSRLGTRDRPQELTAAFAIAGLVLLLGGAATSQRWLGRLA